MNSGAGGAGDQLDHDMSESQRWHAHIGCRCIGNSRRYKCLEGEYSGMHSISKLNTAMVDESHGLLKRTRCVLGESSSCIILFSILTAPKEEVHGFAP